MKKIIKGLSILVASSALCAGIALSSGCSNGYNGTYYGSYNYSKFGQNYGIAVEVVVENNIITKITDITNDKNNAKSSAMQTYKDSEDGEAVYHEWHVVSDGWETFYAENYGWLTGDYTGSYTEGDPIPDPSETAVYSYAWTDEDAAVWTNYENWLLQQYVGKSVAEILEVNVFFDSYGEPYATKGGYNAELLKSELLITNSTQGSGRLMLAVQNALKSK